jgi:predicted SAM-dependent methyltransferase
VRRLQLGTGPNPLPGWLNTDLYPDIYPEHRDKIVFLDASKPLPLEDMSFDYVFSEHQIEHIPWTDALTMIRECFRILRPQGRIRIATPDLAAILGLYGGPLDELERHYVDWVMARHWSDVRSGNPRCYVVNKTLNAHGHQFIYDYETLSAMLTDAGFVELARWEPGESDSPVLRAIEAHGRALGDEDVNRLETMVLEGVRPLVTRVSASDTVHRATCESTGSAKRDPPLA